MKILWVTLAILVALYGIGRGIEDISWIEVIALNLASLVLALWAVGAYAKSRLRKRYPPPGELVTSRNRHMHMNRSGDGIPTVVLEAGLGPEAALSWEPIISELSRVTRVVSYDRAGYGWSDPGDPPRTASAMVAELHEMLAAAGKGRPTSSSATRSAPWSRACSPTNIRRISREWCSLILLTRTRWLGSPRKSSRPWTSTRWYG